MLELLVIWRLTVHIGNAAASLSGSSGSVPVFFFFPFLAMGIMVVGGIVFVVYGLIAAGMVLQGRDFRYILIGNLLKNYLHKGNGG